MFKYDVYDFSLRGLARCITFSASCVITYMYYIDAKLELPVLYTRLGSQNISVSDYS